MLKAAAITAALTAATVAPLMMIPPQPVADPTPSTGTQRVQVVVQAFDAGGRSVPFDGTVTIADRSGFSTVPVHTTTDPSLLDLHLASTGFWSFLAPADR
jgi:hypothetical protein